MIYSRQIRKCDLDQFYTQPEVVADCLKSLGCLGNFDCIIEPSAGDGAFYSQIKHQNKIGLDIQPMHKNIKKQDWLLYQINSRYRNVAVVGNPPFGKSNKLSSAFIKHALSFANVSRIGFILPDVYNKHTRQAVLPKEWRIKSIWKLPPNSFLYGGEARHMPCSFFVFCKSNGVDLRTATTLPYIPDFSFSNNEDYDLFIFGAAPTKMAKKAMPNNRGYFLKSHIGVDKLADNFKAIEWKGNSCANGGVFWLTKYELAAHYYKHHISE